jgi:hypothetical protein
MRHRHRTPFMSIITATILLFSVAYADEAKQSGTPQPGAPQQEEKDKKHEPMASTPIYKPPVRGAPGGRVGGGTRGVAGAAKTGPPQTFILSVVAPDHTGQTVEEQPILYWYLSKPISMPIEFTLTDDEINPIVELFLTPPHHGGMQRIKLADHGVRLELGKAYKWFVSVVADPKRRSKDILAGGAIERVVTGDTLLPKLEQASLPERPHVLAEAGLWYDAISAISEMIETNPSDHRLRQQRAALLGQVGLGEIAQTDLVMMGGD